MLFGRLVLLLVIILVLYYATVIGQILGVFRIAHGDIRFPMSLIPFYYWFSNGKPKNPGEGPQEPTENPNA